MTNDKITNTEAMTILGIKTKAAMSKVAKKYNLSTTKEWKNVFYCESEILALKDKREKERTSKKPNANFKERKDKIKDEKIAKAKNALPAPTKTNTELDTDARLKNKNHAVIKELKDIGLYECCDKSLIYSYCVNDVKLDEVINQMSGNFTTYDHNGNKIPHPLTKVYNILMGIKTDLARALGLGAGNRKGLKVSEIIEIDEMDKLLDG